MHIDAELLKALSIANANYQKIADLFGLTEEERFNVNAGEWIIDRIKQYQTSYIIAKAVKDKRADTIEAHFPEVTNPLVSDTTTE